jgi:hypothetical protein
MSAEEAHELGREGVFKVKQFLESTTHLQVPWTAYDHKAVCTRQRLDGTKKVYDLRGFFLGERRRPLYIEAKNYSTPGGQGILYREYLADVYSITAKAVADDMDEESEFMWITWHPFSQSAWTRLATHDYIREAVLKYSDCLGLEADVEPEDVIDDEMCRLVASRLWIIVLTERQHQLVLTPDELKLAMTKLNREGA